MLRKTIFLLLAGLVSACSSDFADDEDSTNDALTWLENGCTGAARDSQRCDQGLYWFGKGDRAEKWRPGVANAYFDPTKPTLIYVHGWQAEAYKTHNRETFNYKNNDPEHGVDIDLGDAWIDKGWNIGVFYWNRLSDDGGTGWFTEPYAAEAKIWTTHGPTGMRWRKDDGSFETQDVPTKPASELFFDEYAGAMRGYRGPHVRIAGHSLGNQMAVRVSELISKSVDAGKLPSAAMPKRVALLDPYWTKQKQGDTRVGPARDVRDAVYMLARNGVAIEQYRTSSINDYGLGDDNLFVEENAAYTELYPDYFGWFNSLLPWKYLRSDHRAAPNLYFWSLQFSPPDECGGKRGVGLSASASDATVRSMMGPGRYWVQGGGAKTPTPSDDCVTLKTDVRPKLKPVGLTWTRGAPGALTVQVAAPPEAEFARYYVDGHRVAKINRAAGGPGFQVALQSLPTNALETLIVASVFDKDDQLIGTTEDMIDFVSGTAVYIRQQGGMSFEVGLENPPPGLAKLELDVDGAAVTDELTLQRRTARKAVRATYPKVDAVKRTFVVRGYDAANREIVKLERHFILR